MSKPLESLEAYQKLDEIMQLSRKAVHEAQEESRRQGVPNVYSINGHIYYELPNGQLSLKKPAADGSA